MSLIENYTPSEAKTQFSSPGHQMLNTLQSDASSWNSDKVDPKKHPLVCQLSLQRLFWQRSKNFKLKDHLRHFQSKLPYVLRRHHLNLITGQRKFSLFWIFRCSDSSSGNRLREAAFLIFNLCLVRLLLLAMSLDFSHLIVRFFFRQLLRCDSDRELVDRFTGGLTRRGKNEILEEIRLSQGLSQTRVAQSLERGQEVRITAIRQEQARILPRKDFHNISRTTAIFRNAKTAEGIDVLLTIIQCMDFPGVTTPLQRPHWNVKFSIFINFPEVDWQHYKDRWISEKKVNDEAFLPPSPKQNLSIFPHTRNEPVFKK